MAASKITVTLDRAKADEARQLVGAASTSEVLDVALDRLIRAERLRLDIVAYEQTPPTREEVRLTNPVAVDLEDGTDWEALYQDLDARDESGDG